MLDVFRETSSTVWIVITGFLQMPKAKLPLFLAMVPVSRWHFKKYNKPYSVAFFS
jgi:hypothetical protein